MEVQLPAEIAPPTTPASARAGVHYSSERMLNPFTVLVDTAEELPFTFQGFNAYSDRKNRLLVVEQGVNLFRYCLGRYPNSLGDYSLDHFIGRCHVERKSMEDAHGTILDHPDPEAPADKTTRRQRFEKELANLSNCEAAMVVVECSEEQLLDEAPEYDQGKKTAACNRRILDGSIRAYRQDYLVQWVFCGSRRRAEEVTFRFLERFYRKHKHELKKKELKR